MTGKILPRIVVSVLASLIFVSGCGSRQSYDKKYYVLNTVRHSENIRTKNDSILDVRRFTIDSPYSGKGLVYRKSELEYQSDFYNEFLVSPEAMITEKTRNWLVESGLFGTVLDVGSLVEPTHFIEGNITALYGDVRDELSPKAIVEMRIFLLKTKATGESIPVFAEKYKAIVDIKSEEPEDLVKGFNKCIEDILSSLEKDLTEQVSSAGQA